MEFFAGPDSQAVTLVLSFLTTQELLRVRCCCKGVQARTRDQTLWREACQRDFGVDVPVSSGTPVAAAAASVSSSGSITFSPPASPAETTWTSLMAEYGRYFAGYARVEKFVARCEAWASSHFPELLPTMRPGVSDPMLDELEASVGPLPEELRLLYRLWGGQSAHSLAQPPMLSGFFGGFIVYERASSSRFLTPTECEAFTTMFRDAGNIPATAVIFAISEFDRKATFLDVDTGHVMITSPSLNVQKRVFSDEPPRSRGSGFFWTDLMPWLEEYITRLETGMYQLKTVTLAFQQRRYISLFPRTGPTVATAVTNGVRIIASPLYIVIDAPVHYWGYEIRMDMMEDSPIVRAQLETRTWIIDGDGKREQVSGPGVIGLYPIVEIGKPQFSYASATTLQSVPGTMGGHFTLITGTSAAPTGPRFNAVVPQFELSLPAVLY